MDNKANAKYSWAAAFSVASVWFGTHVGGGFASGNQVIQYFAKYGWTAAIIPLIAMGLLACVMYIVMRFAKANGFDNYKDTFRALYPKPWMEVFFEIFYIVIILAAVAAAVAGAGEVLANFLGIQYVGTSKLLFNLLITAILILLSIFGVKLVRMASTVMSIAILIITAIVVIAGFAADFDSLSAKYALEHTAYVDNIGKAVWNGIIVYAGFQCVSIPPMIAASADMSQKGVKRSCILGWLMNGLALCASGAMLTRWYPLLAAMTSNGIDGYSNALSIPNQSVLSIIGIKWIIAVFSILLFCAFVSTCVTLVYSMIQRFQGYMFPNAIKHEKVRGIIVGAIVIGLCFLLSMLGLSGIIKYAYGYDGYYAILVVVLPAFIWGIPKTKKILEQKKAD